MTTDHTATATTPHLDAADEPELVRAPRATFVSVTGAGRPGTEAFYRTKERVRAIAHALPPTLRAAAAADVVELLYWFPEDSTPVGIADFYWTNPIDDLRYRVLAQVDEATTAEDLAGAALSTAGATDAEPELFTLPERLVVQVMHHGPFAGEVRTLAGLGAFAADHGVRRVGPHHEIHLDPFTADTPQDRLRTILRDPVA